MKKLHFPKPFLHRHPPIRNVNELFDEQKTIGQRAADRVAKTVGSWKFIIIQSTILSGWAVLNITAWIQHWDPYPFILVRIVLQDRIFSIVTF